MTREPQKQGLIRKSELVKALNVSPRTIEYWLADRIIPVIAVSQRLQLFDLEEVKLALKRQFEIPSAQR